MVVYKLRINLTFSLHLQLFLCLLVKTSRTPSHSNIIENSESHYGGESVKHLIYLFCFGSIPENNSLFSGSLPENNFLFSGRLPENKELFSGILPKQNKYVKCFTLFPL